MKIGVVMPTYNQADFLPAALASYFAQTVPSDLVIVNDGSMDRTQQVLMGTPELHWVEHPKNMGTASAINSGIASLLSRATKYDAFTWISSDNVMDPKWLEVLSKEMSVFGAGAVYAGFWYESPGKAPFVFFRKHTKDGLLNDVNCYYGPAFLIRRDVWEEAGPHRGRITHDYDHWLRVEEVCYRRNLPIFGVEKPLCRYIAHEGRATVTRRHEFDAFEWQAEARKRRGR